VLDDARPEAVARQHALGKLTARERIARLLDDGSFRELGGLVQPSRATPDTADVVAPADGVVTGTGRIDGRPAVVMASDFTVLGGSNGTVGELKVERCARLALDHGLPFVMLLDGGGHRIQEGLDSRHFAWGHTLFGVLGALSGWAPVVAAIMGPGFAGPSNFASLADFVVMVRETATMGVAGPALVKAGTGEEVDAQTLGGPREQAHRNGIADLVADDEDACLHALRTYLSFLPSNAREAPPRTEPREPPAEVAASIGDVVPFDTRRAYDVRAVIAGLVDGAETLEVKPRFARNIVTTLARIDGRPVGIVANQAAHLAGTLDTPACEKAAHFISVCDAFGLPLVFLVDVPGFKVGLSAERSGLARRAGKLLYELAQATVPRFTVVLRKGYGLAYIAMCGGRSFGADLSVAWPQAEISAMTVEGAVDVAYRRKVTAAPDPEAYRRELIERFRGQLGAARAAEAFGIDDVIAPAETRPALIDALGRCTERRAVASRRYHGITPI
jgi:acetyl-CoA carboxylase carboxyltransferase component